MPNFVSPGVYVIEKDISDYPAQVNSSVVGIVGFADRGPIAGLNQEKATLITSQQGLIDEFGSPSEDITGQALEGALEILEQTNSVYFSRAAGSTAADASSTVTLGACPAVIFSGPETNLPESSFGIGQPLYLRVQVYNNAGVAQYSTAKTFSIPAGTVTAGTWGVALNDTTNFSGTSLGMLTAKAWVNFNGTSTVAIRDDFNVSSVTDNGTGEYTINIDADMTNQLYCYIGNVGQGGSNPEDRGASIGGNVLRDSFEFHTLNLGGGHYDGVNCCAVVYGSDRVSFSNATNPTP